MVPLGRNSPLPSNDANLSLLGNLRPELKAEIKRVGGEIMLAEDSHPRAIPIHTAAYFMPSVIWVGTPNVWRTASPLEDSCTSGGQSQRQKKPQPDLLASHDSAGRAPALDIPLLPTSSLHGDCVVTSLRGSEATEAIRQSRCDTVSRWGGPREETIRKSPSPRSSPILREREKLSRRSAAFV
jgi:hypothetical protein